MVVSFKHISWIINSNMFPLVYNSLEDKAVHNFTYVCIPLFATQICLQK